MPAPTECTICRRILPLGGVLDGVGRPVHLVCRELAKRETAEYARITAKRVAREGKPTTSDRSPLPLEKAAIAS
jgi:hypothetical protein